MNKRIEKWENSCAFFLPLIDRYPEFIPILHTVYSSLEIDLDKNHVKKCNFDNRMFSLSRGKNVSRILLFPFSSRSNCLGSCKLISNNLPKDKYIYLQNSKRQIDLGSHIDDIVHIKPEIHSINIFRISLLVKVFLKYLVKTNNINLYNLIKIPKIVIKLIHVQSLLPAAKKIIVDYNIDYFLSPNEQNFISSIFTVAARMQGICSGQFLHGLPTLLYLPSFSSDFWIWGKTTSTMLGLDNSKEDNLVLSGSLEFSGNHKSLSKYKAPKNRTRVLFLSQLVGDRIWETSVFSEAFQLVVDAISRINNMHLKIRMHPQADYKIRNNAKKYLELKGCSFSFSTNEEICDDINECDFICTASSSGIIGALQMKKPISIIWLDELNDIHGEAFLPKEFISRTTNELIDKIEKTDNIKNEIYEKAIKNLCGDLAPEKKIASMLTSEKQC